MLELSVCFFNGRNMGNLCADANHWELTFSNQFY